MAGSLYIGIVIERTHILLQMYGKSYVYVPPTEIRFNSRKKVRNTIEQVNYIIPWKSRIELPTYSKWPLPRGRMGKKTTTLDYFDPPKHIMYRFPTEESMGIVRMPMLMTRVFASHHFPWLTLRSEKAHISVRDDETTHTIRAQLRKKRPQVVK